MRSSRIAGRSCALTPQREREGDGISSVSAREAGFLWNYSMVPSLGTQPFRRPAVRLVRMSRGLSQSGQIAKGMVLEASVVRDPSIRDRKRNGRGGHRCRRMVVEAERLSE